VRKVEGDHNMNGSRQSNCVAQVAGTYSFVAARELSSGLDNALEIARRVSGCRGILAQHRSFRKPKTALPRIKQMKHYSVAQFDCGAHSETTQEFAGGCGRTGRLGGDHDGVLVEHRNGCREIIETRK